jgi:hypothetical protein
VLALRNFHATDRSVRIVKGIARIMVLIFYHDEPMNLNYVLVTFLVGSIIPHGKIYGKAGKISLHLRYVLWIKYSFSIVNTVSCLHVF